MSNPWDDFSKRVCNDNKNVAHVAVTSNLCGCETIWGKTDGFSLENTEVQCLQGEKKSKLFENGVILGGIQCRLLQDQLDTEGQYRMDLRTKGEPGNTAPVVIGKSCQALMIIVGTKEAQAGDLNNIMYNEISNLRKSNM
ncbi:profilin-1 [Antennarius striatus]|uniref:profilin-1 n=1 Tax=Antennarius striatus TaxID=241820 RepID=UPI0035B08992